MLYGGLYTTGQLMSSLTFLGESVSKTSSKKNLLLKLRKEFYKSVTGYETSKNVKKETKIWKKIMLNLQTNDVLLF